MTHEYSQEMEDQYGSVYDLSFVLSPWKEIVRIDLYIFQWR